MRLLVLIYLAMVCFCIGVPYAVGHKANYLAKHGQQVSAKLLKYEEVYGRSSNTVFGWVEFKGPNKTYTLLAPIADNATREDRDFWTAKQTGHVPIIYNPKNPSSFMVDFDGSDSLSHESGFYFLLGGLGLTILSLIFLPAIIILARQKPTSGTI